MKIFEFGAYLPRGPFAIQHPVARPQLFLLWAAGLAEPLRAPGISPYVYADDTDSAKVIFVFKLNNLDAGEGGGVPHIALLSPLHLVIS